ncbi:hypothetical protein MLPM_0959 [Mycobacterium lepromatosis]|uniref:Uncharacterized protein n=1 Tax=Mycobacterium lepromatosis TaxID=480418 RepID=A0A0F4ES24_9MYCO|nr:hypothetical protein MLPM_0959 [Mycobacterium lepromatosis]
MRWCAPHHVASSNRRPTGRSHNLISLLYREIHHSSTGKRRPHRVYQHGNSRVLTMKWLLILVAAVC